MELTNRRTTETTTSELTSVKFTVHARPPAIHLEASAINLHGCEWVYEFGEDQDALMLVFASDPVLSLAGCAVELDAEGRRLEKSAVILTQGEDSVIRHVWSCPLSTEAPRIQIWFYEPTAAGQGALPDDPTILEPNQANPTMTLKPKRTSPAGGKSGPQTGDT